MSRRSRFIFKGLLIVSLAFAFYFLIFKSDFFKVKHCELKGSAIVSLESLERDAVAPIGKNIWLVNEEELSFEIEKRWFVKVLRVLKRYPSSIVIELEDQIPIAVIKSSNGLWLMSLRGLLWPILDVKKLPKGLCVVNYGGEIAWFPGKPIESSDLKGLLELFSAMNGIEEVDVRYDCFFVKGIDYDVLLPKGDDLSFSLHRFKTVYDELSKERKGKGLIFDLRFDDMVIVRERMR